MNIEKELRELAETILPPGSSDNIQTFAHWFEKEDAEDWVQEIIDEGHNLDRGY